ncbi:MAG: sensor histidine kinase [Marinilabiliaceae bacterium]|nr:sensor histidine kinase [Marinilabiliaceae bacterium]
MLNKKWILHIVHIIIWVGYSFLVFTGPMRSSSFAIEITIRSLFLNAVVFYINTYFLLPKLVGKNKLLHYALTTLILLLSISLINKYAEEQFRKKHFNTLKYEKRLDFLEKNQSSFNNDIPQFDDKPDILHLPLNKDDQFRFFNGPGIIMGFLSTLGILFLSTIFWVIIESDKRNKREMLLVNENLKTEMKFLKSQINPHFLFNVLNNVYSLAVIQSNKTPEMILKLSDMLRFMLYETEDKKIKLGRELDYIVNFIEFQKIKIEGEPRIKLDINYSNRDLMIEPMLLIPFVENSFKHSKIEDIKNSWIHINILTKETAIFFNIENNLLKSNIFKDKIGGIGIENVKKRLLHLYPNKHKLSVKQLNNKFSVSLMIQT